MCVDMCVLCVHMYVNVVCVCVLCVFICVLYYAYVAMCIQQSFNSFGCLVKSYSA